MWYCRVNRICERVFVSLRRTIITVKLRVRATGAPVTEYPSVRQLAFIALIHLYSASVSPFTLFFMITILQPSRRAFCHIHKVCLLPSSIQSSVVNCGRYQGYTLSINALHCCLYVLKIIFPSQRRH